MAYGPGPVEKIAVKFVVGTFWVPNGTGRLTGKLRDKSGFCGQFKRCDSQEIRLSGRQILPIC